MLVVLVVDISQEKEKPETGLQPREPLILDMHIAQWVSIGAWGSALLCPFCSAGVGCGPQSTVKGVSCLSQCGLSTPHTEGASNNCI